MNSLSDHFRHWYEHERDSNAKVLAMLDSVPDERRGDPMFRKALDLMAHMIFWRRMWLHRLGPWQPSPATWQPDGTPLEEMPALVAATEEAWTRYLASVNDDALDRDTVMKSSNGKTYRWRTENILHQVAGHHWYHRGQIAILVTMLGGKAVSTDYYFWNPPNSVS